MSVPVLGRSKVVGVCMLCVCSLRLPVGGSVGVKWGCCSNAWACRAQVGSSWGGQGLSPQGGSFLSTAKVGYVCTREVKAWVQQGRQAGRAGRRINVCVRGCYGARSNQ